MKLAVTTHAAAADALAVRVAAGERAAIARALNVLDDARPSARTDAARLLHGLPTPEQLHDRHLIGITGPPGVGKSSLISALIAHWRSQSLSVGVLAVDPTSHLSGGALLGDRLRMRVVDTDDGVFIRSLASRGSYGGLAPQLLPMAAVMLAAFDRVVIETVGVGQREVDVAFAADTTCLVVQPAAGDSVQFLKAGIMEVPDVLVVNKSDLGEVAMRAQAELSACVSDPSSLRVLATSATCGDGIPELANALSTHHQRLLAAERLGPQRRAAQVGWLIERLREEFGTHGVNRIGGASSIEATFDGDDAAILAHLERARERVLAALSAPLNQTPNSTHTKTT